MKRVVFDTDIGIDDAMALLFLHYSPEVSLEAICTVSGNASIENTTRNALHVCERFAIDAPVFVGAAGPLGPALTSDYPDFVHGKNGLGDISFDEPARQPDSQPAAEAIVELAKKNPGALSIVAVGRLTNIAHALRLCPELPTLIDELVVMGGVFMRDKHIGNVSPVAEANIGGDPEAADMVFSSGMSTTIVGLDVTQETVMDEVFINQLRGDASEAGDFIFDITRYYFDFYASLSGERRCPIHDSSAVAYLLAPDLYQTETGAVRVATQGIAMGQTIFGPDGDRYAIDAWCDKPTSRICTAVNADAVKSLYLETLCSGTRYKTVPADES